MATTMNVAMTLRLLDEASPEIRKFIGFLETLEKAVMSASGKIATFAEGIAGIATASKTAAGGVVETADAAATLSGALTGVNTRLTNAVTRLGELTAEAGTAAASMLNLGRASAEANIAGSLAGAGAGVRAVTGEVNTLADSIKGMAALWAAFQIEKGLKTAIGDAAEFERTENKLKNLNLSATEFAEVNKAVSDTGAAFPQFDRNQLLEMAIDLRNATGSAHEASIGLKSFAEAIFAINLSMPSGQKLDQSSVLNVAKILDARGASMDPEKRAETLDVLAKITAGTQGRVNPNNLFSNVTYAKGGLGQTMDNESLLVLAAMIEQDAVNGSGAAGRVGNMVTQFVNSVTKSRAVTTKNRDEWLKLGLIDPSKVNINENTGNVTSIQAGAISGTEIIGTKFRGWVEEYLRPALVAAGVDMSNLGAIKQKTDVLFPNTNAAEAAFQLLARKALLDKDIGNIKQTSGVDKQVEEGAKLAAAAFERFHTAVHNLSIAIGTTLLPVLTPLIQGISDTITKLAGFTTAHPMFGFLLGATAAFGSLSAAIFGMQKLFGPIAGLFGGVATEAGGMGAVLTTVGEVIAVASAFILRSMLRLVPIVGLILLAWDFAPIIGNLEVGGHKISEWAEAISGKVVDFFTESWKKLTKWAEQTSFDVSGFLLAMFPTVGLAVKAAEFIGQLDVFGKPIKAWAADLADYVAGKFRSMLDVMSSFSSRAGLANYVAPDEGVGVGFGSDAAARGKAVENWAFRDKAGSDFVSSLMLQSAASGALDESKPKSAADLDPHKAERDRNAAAAAALLGKKEKKGRFAHYNAAADTAAQDYKLDEDALRNTLKIEEALYKAHGDSIADHYAKVQILSQLATDKEIADLERKKAALLSVKAKDIDQHAVKAVDTQIAELQAKRKADVETNEIKKKEDLLTLDKLVASVDEDTYAASGRRQQAKLVRMQQTYDATIKQLVVEEKFDVAERERENKTKATAALGYGDAYEEVKRIQEARKLGEEQINLQVANGLKTTIDGENEKYALRQKEAAQIDLLIGKLREMAVASGDRNLVNQIDELSVKTQGALQELTPEMQKFKVVVEGAFTNFFSNIMKGTMSAKAIFKSFFDDILKGIESILAKQMAEKMTSMFFPGTGTGGAAGGGGGLGGLINAGMQAVTMYFKGAGAASATAPAAAAAGSAGGGLVGSSAGAAAFGPATLALASGTDYVPRDMLAAIHKGEMVIPAGMANTIRSGKSARPMQVNNYFNVPAPTRPETQSQIAVAVGGGLQRAMRRS